jgi:high frequency lysogenization protein
VINNFAGAYVDTVGTLRFRLQIKGQSTKITNRRRSRTSTCGVIAGIRAAWLWKRLGGRRWHLLLTRSQILDELRMLIKEVR